CRLPVVPQPFGSAPDPRRRAERLRHSVRRLGRVHPSDASRRADVTDDPRDVILRPVVSEKTVSLNENGVYTFVVHPGANRVQIRQAVEQLFGVRVAKVNTLNRKGKRKRNRRTFTYGTRPDIKRATVTLMPGDRTDLVEG